MHRYRNAIFGLIPFAMAMNVYPVHAAEECSLSKLTTIELNYDVVGRPIIPVTLDNFERYLLIDTGGAYSTIDSAPAEAFGLRTRRANATIMGVTGERSSNFVTVEEFRMGTVRGEDRPFMISPGDPGADSEIRSIGTISPDILQRFDVDFDFGSSIFNMFSQDHCEGTVIYWQPKLIAIIPFELASSGHITFPVTLDGVELIAILDTGAAQSTINLDVAEDELGLDFSSEENQQVGTLGDDGDAVFLHEFQLLRMEGIEIAEPTLTVLPDLMSSNISKFFGLRSGIRLPEPCSTD